MSTRSPMSGSVRPELQEKGTNVAVVSTPRIPAASVDPTVKNFHWGDLTGGPSSRRDRDAGFEYRRRPARPRGQRHRGAGLQCLRGDRTGRVRLATVGCGLEGITRRSVLELCDELGIPCDVRQRSRRRSSRRPTDLLRPAGGVMPASRAGRASPVGRGAPGPATTAIRDRYWALHDDPRFTLAVDYEAASGRGPAGVGGERQPSWRPNHQRLEGRARCQRAAQRGVKPRRSRMLSLAVMCVAALVAVGCGSSDDSSGAKSGGGDSNKPILIGAAVGAPHRRRGAVSTSRRCRRSSRRRRK